MDAENRNRYETSLRDFLNVVFKRKWIVVGVVGLATFLVYFLNARRPNLYESVSKILVRRGEQTNAITGYVRYGTWEEEVASQLQVILSEAVFSRAEAMFEDSVRVHRYPSHWRFNRAAVRADVIGESNAFYIAYVDLDPGVCRLGCEVMTLAFRDYYRENKTPPELSDFFASEIASVRADLDAWRQRRQDFLEQARFYGAEETSKFLLSKVSRLEERMLSIDTDISSAQIRVRTLGRLARMRGDQLEQELAMIGPRDALQSSSLQRIKFTLTSLNVQREELAQKYTPNHPELRAVNQQIAALHADLKREVESAYRAAAVELEDLQAQRTDIQKELDATKAELEVLPDKARRLAEIEDMIDKLENQHRLLLQRQAEAEISRAGQPAWEVSILSHASPPTARKKSDYARLALGPFLAMIVALGIAFFMESVDHSIDTGAEAEEFLGVPVLATVSEFEADGEAGGTPVGG